jgi:hypothetical protein
MVVRNKVNRGSNRYVVVGPRRASITALAAIAIATAISAATETGIAIGKGVASKRENERAREEARRLAEIQRSDTLKFQSELNKLNERQLKNNQNSINFNRSLLGVQVNEQNKQKQFTEDTANQSILEQTADQNLDPLKINRRRFL